MISINTARDTTTTTTTTTNYYLLLSVKRYPDLIDLFLSFKSFRF